MNCPHCGSAETSEATRFDCGTRRIPGSLGTITCYDRQISQLKAELSQCVRRKDRRIIDAMVVLGDGAFSSFDRDRSFEAQQKLQSIIEGK